MPAKLQGTYQKINSTLINQKNNIQLVVCHRKNPTGNKPPKYLLEKIGKRYKYISSLYPIDSNKYEIDCSGVHYHINFIQDSAIIVRK